jgi:CheY-like chemotaxis protein
MPRILIIEDDTIVANIYRNKFQGEGYAVMLASDGEHGVEMALTDRPDLVIVDLMLPKMNGVEVIRRLRSRPETASTPVIVFSNSYVSTLIQAAWNAGANNCLTKATCTPKQLIDVVERTLAKAGSMSAGAAASYAPIAGAYPGGDPAAPAQAAPARPPPPPQRYIGSQIPAAAPYRHLAARDDDEMFQDDLRRSFLSTAPATLISVRSLFSMFGRAEGEPEKVQRLQELYRKVHSLTSNAAITGLSRIAQMSAALEALVKELCEKPKNINASTSRTIAHAVDFLGVLIDHANQLEAAPAAPNILVVDDEMISRRAVVYALDKAGLKCVSVEDPMVAHAMLEENRFDLVFLDVDMPGMTGFELCEKLRKMPNHAKTPVVFVTAMSDFESRARSTLSGGNDLIGKPFLFMELAVKAVMFLMRGQLAAQRA